MIDERDCDCDCDYDYVDVAVIDSVDGRQRIGGGRWRRHCFGGCGAWRGQQEEEDEAAATRRD